MRKLAVVLLSGGLDSTTAAALAREQGFEVTALTVDYGQTHRREIDAARQVARALDIAHHLFEVPLFREIAWYSALTGSDRYATPINRSPLEMAGAIPLTYVPLRNTFLLTLAAAGIESLALHLIEADRVAPSDLTASIFIAANAIDYSGYPDCRPAYYAAAAETIRLGSKLGTHYGVPIRIETPLLDKTKAEIVRLALALGAPLDDTWSCYAPGPRPCGRCDSCLLRAKGFAEAGVPDPALVTPGTADAATDLHV
ncbi:MAG: 7-cyano-7-deazaguanine synthase QueC [Chloroflexi bacterium]|nr:7-cyano-7-deazaguanine synthase QueC [Chloroflexota bacterium]